MAEAQGSRESSLLLYPERWWRLWNTTASLANLEDRGVYVNQDARGSANRVTSLEIRPTAACDDALVVSQLPSLVSLDLSDRRMGAQDAALLGNALGTALTYVSLRGTELGMQGVAALAPALRGLPRVAALDLSACALGPGGAREIAGPLAALTALTWLSLRSNAVGDVGVRALVLLLRKLGGLAYLDLMENAIGDAGLVALAAALPALSALSKLKLAGNAVSEEAKCALPATARLSILW